MKPAGIVCAVTSRRAAHGRRRQPGRRIAVAWNGRWPQGHGLHQGHLRHLPERRMRRPFHPVSHLRRGHRRQSSGPPVHPRTAFLEELIRDACWNSLINLRFRSLTTRIRVEARHTRDGFRTPIARRVASFARPTLRSSRRLSTSMPINCRTRDTVFYDNHAIAASHVDAFGRASLCNGFGALGEYRALRRHASTSVVLA